MATTTTVDDDTRMAATLGRRLDAAREAFNAGQPARAARQYDALRRRCSHALADRPAVGALYARALLGLALSSFEVSGDLDASAVLLDEAESIAERCLAPDVAVAIRGQRGVLLLRAGRTGEAYRALNRAVATVAAAAPYDQVTILLNRGTLGMEHGQLRPARTDLQRAAEIAARTGHRELEHRARHNLGYAEFIAGRIPAALAAMDRAAALSEGPPHPIALLDRARVLREAGLGSDADRLLEDAAQLFAAGRLHQDVGETRLAQAECALTEGDVARARRLAVGAERMFARRGNRRWQRSAELMVLRCERRALDARSPARRTASLRALAERASRLALGCRDEGRADLARQAELLELECLLRAGDDLVQPQAVPPMHRSDPLPVRLATREVRALAWRRRDDRRAAADEVCRGLAELGSYQNRFGSLDLRTASAVHGRPLAHLGLEIAAETGRPGAVFAALERGRAVSTRLSSVGPPTDERTADLLAELRRTEERARTLAGDPQAGEELAALRSRVAALRHDVRARAWEVEGRAGPGQRARSETRIGRAPRLGRVRAVAREHGAAFVSYLLHEGRWGAVRVTGGRPQVLDLAAAGQVGELVSRVRADLDALALRQLPPPLAAAVRGSLDAGLRRLDDLLLAPLRVGARPLVVSGTDALVLLPWSLLPSRRGLPVVVTPSASAWLRAAESPAPRRAPARVVAVAGPGLLRAEEEADLVRRTWPGGADLLTGDDASTAAVARALVEADVVHVAAHGTHQQESPLFSSLRLADGPLFAYELDADAARPGPGVAPCVVLSACEAGLATVRPGDEGLGLTSVLLHLGSVSVLAGVARVGDGVAARVMGSVHESLSRGTDAAAALAAALAVEPEPAPFVAFGATW